jgi:hypothetical protein
VKDELGITLDKADESVLGLAAKVVVGKESCTIVGDGRTQVCHKECVWGGGRGGRCLGLGVGLAAKAVVGKESCTIVGDGRTQVCLGRGKGGRWGG